MKTPVAAALFLLLASCEFLDPAESVVIELPAVPPALEGFAGAEGLLLEGVFPGDCRPLGILPWGGRAEMILPRGGRVAYLAWPLAAGKGGFFLPAGSLYPDGLRGGKLRLEFREGAAVQIAARLLRAGVLPEGFRYDRLAVEMEARAEDPWMLDLDRIVAAIARGGMNLREIAFVGRRDVSVGAGGGPWKSGDPFAPALSAPLSGSFPLGETLFFDGEGFARLFVPSSGPPEWSSLGSR